jgi:RNA polymerase sigma factor (sigma-70 family)
MPTDTGGPDESAPSALVHSDNRGKSASRRPPCPTRKAIPMADKISPNASTQTYHGSILDEYVLERIDYRVRRLADKFGLDGTQRDDYRHDMVVRLLHAASRFNPARAKWHTFACRVLDRHYRHLLRRMLAPQNNGVPSVVAFCDCGDNYEDSVVAPATAGRDPHAADDLRMDMETAISAMPERLQVIARLLMVHLPSAVARILGTSPAAITRAMARIRVRFEEAGLAEF